MQHTTNIKKSFSKTIRGKILKTDLAYMAGLLDGEGHVFIQKRVPGNREKAKSPLYVLSIGITNTHAGVIEWLQQRYVGSRSIRTREKQPKKNWRTCYFWTLSSIRAAEFLALISPYLLIKRKQAELAIEFQNLIQGRKTGNKIRLNENEIAERESYRQRISDLNHGITRRD